MTNSPAIVTDTDSKAWALFVAQLVEQELDVVHTVDAAELVEALRSHPSEAELHEQFKTLKEEAELQHKLWLKASEASTKRSRDYRLPKLPAPYAALTPQEYPELSADRQTDFNYLATLTALRVCSKLILRQGNSAGADTVLLRDSVGDIFMVSLPAGRTRAELKKAYFKSLKQVQRISAENYEPEVVLADMVTQGYGCKGPLDLMHWSEFR